MSAYIQIFSEKRHSHLHINAPCFKTFDDALNYIRQNTGYFENGDRLVIVDFLNNKSRFITLRYQLTLWGESGEPL